MKGIFECLWCILRTNSDKADRQMKDSETNERLISLRTLNEGQTDRRTNLESKGQNLWARLFKRRIAYSRISENVVDNFPIMFLRKCGIFFYRFWVIANRF